MRSTGDFNGDTKSDIVWQNDDGRIEIWEMDGTRLIASGQPGVVDASWHVRGTGDFNGDSRSDILWQNDNGTVYIWEMDGTKIVNHGQAGIVDASWHIRGVGDFNGDSKSDILWQNDDGTVVDWLMDGFAAIDSGVLGIPDASWHIIPPDNSGAITATVSASPAVSDVGFDFADVTGDAFTAGPANATATSLTSPAASGFGSAALAADLYIPVGDPGGLHNALA